MLVREKKGRTDSIYLLLDTVNPKRGGLTRNLLRRAKLLSESSQHDIHILTFDFNPNYKQIRACLEEKSLINECVYIHNLYEHLAIQSGFSQPLLPFQEPPIEEEGLQVDPVMQKNAYRLYRNGLYIKYKNYDEKNRLLWIDYFNENRYRTKRETYDYDGRLRRTTYMDYHKNKPKQIRYFDEGGCCYLTKWFNPENGQCTRVNFFYDDNRIDTFKDERDLKISWLDRLADAFPDAIFQTENTRLDKTDELILGMKNNQVAKVKVVHSNHLKNPSDVQGPLLEAHENAINNASSFDAMVFITQKQKEDVRKRFGPRTYYHAIPHSAPIPSNSSTIKRDPWRVVCIARFSRSKKLDHAIKAFRKVVTKFPQARLELWGFGPEEENLRKIIKRLRLEEHVFIKGFTHAALDVFRGAAFSVVCSNREGFGLVIAESMSVGTPVISYDINYGPREMISHEENGLLIPLGKIDKLAAAMIDLFSHQEKRERFGKEARKIVDTMSERTYVTRWLQLYDHIKNKKKHQIKVGPKDCSLTGVKLTNKKTLQVSGEIYLGDKGRINEDLSVSLYLHHPSQQLTQQVPIQMTWNEEGKERFTTEVQLSDLLNGQKTGQDSWIFFLRFSDNDFPVYTPLRAKSNSIQYKRFFLAQGSRILIRCDRQGNVILSIERFRRIVRGLKEKFKKRIRHHEATLKTRIQKWLQVPS
ncbi:poly(glycerol-phosphate) alpha-glucosyltransferase [Marininema mesophilum]|uniref:Poly(Glycerol-phosphate) alpha-glucosyltransferase n=1 Tax=Marininema mesophilum TaxID=1048340 RepID=A0A1H2ZLI6_9BACL|nr:glycosyltransferase [Marininema mesophilum]SDX17609.1 poly(glycerol-phosphate) alpha-glucosyltransferase [Marininema mesophilum]